MLSVQIGVLIDHFRLHPDPEFKTSLIDLLNESFETAFYLIFVYIPVTQAGVIAVSLSKPAIVHYNHLDSERSCFFSKLYDGFICKVKICCLPAVYEYRSSGELILASAYVMADKVMINMRKPA